MTSGQQLNAKPGARLVAAMRRFLANEDGATAIEYSVIIALIFLAIVGAVRGYVNSTSTMYEEISSTLTAS
jgi:pilus assembly protein Flp/PilA